MPLTLDISIFAMPRLTTKQSQNSSLNAGIEIGRFLKNSNSRKLKPQGKKLKLKVKTFNKSIYKTRLCAISHKSLNCVWKKLINLQGKKHNSRQYF